MSIAGSIAGESVYYEEPYSVPGPCRTCCIRCPCPSIIVTIAFLGGVALFCLAAVLGGQQTSELFSGTVIREDMSKWISYISIACYVEVVVMAIIGVALLGISCLGTGSVRKEFMWRFNSRAKGRCQTGLFMILVYFLFLLWLGQSFFSLVPIVFFYIQRRGVCLALLYYTPGEDPALDEPCIELKQWGLVHPDYVSDANNRDKICEPQLSTLCASNVLLWFALAFFAAILVTLTMLHYLINFAANFAKLRDRFKDGFVNRKSGAYLVRSGSFRGSRHSMRARSSLRGSRNNVLRGSKGSLRSVSNHGSNNHVTNAADNTASTLRMTQAYQNQALNGSGDELYAMRHLNTDILDYDREPVSALQNNYVDRPPQPPPVYRSHQGIDEPAVSMTGTDIGPHTVYGNPHANGRAPSHTSSSLSGNASGNYPVNSKLNTLDYNRDIDYKRDDYYPSSNSNFNLKPNNYHDNGILDTVDGSGSVQGSIQHSSAGDNSDGVFGSSRWGHNSQYNDDRNRPPLNSFTDPEPAPSLGSAASDRAPPRGFNEYFI